MDLPTADKEQSAAFIVSFSAYRSLDVVFLLGSVEARSTQFATYPVLVLGVSSKLVVCTRRRKRKRGYVAWTFGH